MKHIFHSFLILIIIPSQYFFGQKTPEYYLSLGNKHYYAKQYKTAIKDYNKAINLNLLYIKAYFNRGIAKEALHQYQDAINDYDKTILINPNHAEAYNNRGRVKQVLKQYEAALEDYTKAIQSDSNRIIAYYNRAWLQLFLKKYTNAIEDYTLFIDKEPNSAKAYHERGLAREALKQHEAALEDYTKAIQSNPNRIITYHNRARLQFFLKKYNNAIRDYTTFIEKEPNSAEAYYERGLTKEALGQHQSALEDFREVLRLKPSHPQATIHLTSLENKLASPVKKSPRIWLVSIGIGSYKYGEELGLSRLNSPVTQAYDFSKTINPFNNSDAPVLYNTKANKKRILEKMNSVFCDTLKVSNEDIVVFYFSGHGQLLSDKIGICPYDFYSESQLISDDDILAILNRSPAKHKICFIEACATSKKESNKFEKIHSQKRKSINDGIVYITSTKVGMESYEYRKIGGYFSHYLLKGISGLADSNGNKIITIKELFDYIQPIVYETSNQKQIPQINQAGYDENLPFIYLED